MRFVQRGAMRGAPERFARGLRFFLFAGACLTVCCSGGDPDEDDGGTRRRDSGERSDAGDVGVGVVRIGTGLDRFEPLTPGQKVDFVRGPQGGGQFFGFHVWHAARLEGYPFDVARVRFELHEAESGEQRAFVERNTALERDGDGKVVFGVAPQVDDCCRVDRKEVIMRVLIESPDAPFGEDEIRVLTTTCADPGGPPVCD